ncbi:hypothetical protein [Noviherbaspirillum malthae]|uniref:hypothetical protein n=1 Tax=Noviherbaspirillum malthae TaxID=1260987 RepID=UPI00188ED96C|nr:hypothetical protein [Noviherbaspirillum malthae]
MSIIKAAVGDTVREFGENMPLTEVWQFINTLMTEAPDEKAIVLMDDGGATLGQIWDGSLYQAFWESPAKMRAYLNLAGFDLGE